MCDRITYEWLLEHLSPAHCGDPEELKVLRWLVLHQGECRECRERARRFFEIADRFPQYAADVAWRKFGEYPRGRDGRFCEALDDPSKVWEEGNWDLRKSLRRGVETGEIGLTEAVKSVSTIVGLDARKAIESFAQWILDLVAPESRRGATLRAPFEVAERRRQVAIAGEVIVAAARRRAEANRVQGSSYLALAHHARGSARILLGRVDDAFDDLGKARDGYADVGLPERLASWRDQTDLESVHSDSLLTSRFAGCCPLTPQAVNALRERSLSKLDDHPYLQTACSECRQKFWAAVNRSRFGLLDDAFRAWWTSEKADPTSESGSVGLFIRLLADSEDLSGVDPRRRISLCARAANLGRVLGDQDLEALALAYQGNAARAASDLQMARTCLVKASSLQPQSAWVRAALKRYSGVLAIEASDLAVAARNLRESCDLLSRLDSHETGCARFHLAEVEFWRGSSLDAIRLLEESEGLLDMSRWHHGQDVLRLHRGYFLKAAGETEEAARLLEAAPSSSHWAPFYSCALGELRLEQGLVRPAIELLRAGCDGLLDIQKVDAAAREYFYLALAYEASGDRGAARRTVEAILEYSTSARLPEHAVAALQRLANAEAERGFRSTIRHLAAICGGVFPPPRKNPLAS